MWPWKKKKANDSKPEFTIPPCSHTWQDFPWILRSYYNDDSKNLHITITEPYVCVHCGKRKDVVLYDANKFAYSRDKADSIHKTYYDQYKDHIGDVAIVEDMINDAILVDREKLKIVEKLRGERNHETDTEETDDNSTSELDRMLFGNPMHLDR